MCDEDIVIIDDSDDELRSGGQSNGVKTVQEVDLLSDSSDSDAIIFEGKVIGDIEFVGRKSRPMFRSRRNRSRNRNSKNNSNNRTIGEHLVSSDSNQSQSNPQIITNGLKDESVTPPKNPPETNQLFKTSPHFESSNHYSSEPLPQTINAIKKEKSSQPSQESDQIPLEDSIHSDITPTVASISPEPIPVPSDTLQDINSIEEPIDVTETDFGVEDNETNEMECNMSLTLTESEPSHSPTPMNRSSTPIKTSLIQELLETEALNQMNDNSMEMSPFNTINQTIDQNQQMNNSFDTTLIVNEFNEVGENQINESIPQSLVVNESNENPKKDIAVGTEDLTFIRRLTFEESFSEPPVQQPEYYMCNCGEEFNNALLYYKHEKKHRMELIRKNIRTFKCVTAGCAFAGLTQMELVYHNSEHRGVFLCQNHNCGFRGDSADDVRHHMKNHRISKKRAFRRKGILCECGECIYSQR